ncbi:MAG TPA: carboxypeptidase-like regulatory domain-containing protein [Blastocatellia bacterium]|nr:carboxypeptidase-like regulatory domain-containing protein [Blastocatellia bacterium]
MQTNVRYLFRALTISILSLSIGIPSFAQNSTGAIRGIVKDPNNAVVTTAIATATSKSTGASRKVKAGNDGLFVFESLQPGEYEVKVEAQGFSTQTQTLTVEVGGTTTADFSVAVGAANQTVDVTADAPVINTTDTTVGGVVNRHQVENLPTNGRSFLSIALLEPGVTVNYNASSGVANPNSYFTVSVGGAPSQMTLITVDGARVNDRITGGTSQNFSSESVQEFQISTNAFDLSSGTVSAGAVNIVSRTGTNSFHGSTFLFFRDHNMAAFPDFKRPTERNAAGVPRNILCVNPNSEGCKRALDPFFVRRQYGGTFGGPIKKDKLFFFANYERNDQVGARTITFTDPVLSAFNHVAGQPQDGHLLGFRLDATLSSKHTAYLRGNIDANDGIAGGGLESTWIASSNYAWQSQIGVTSVLNATLVNDARFSFSYFRNFLNPPTQADCEALGGGSLTCFGVGGPRISFFGGLTIGNDPNVLQNRNPRTIQINDNVNWTKGSHRVRFGGNWEYSYAHGGWGRNYEGTFTAFSPTQILGNPGTFGAANIPAGLLPGGTATFADLLKLPMTGSLSMGVGDPGQPAPFNYNEAIGNHHVRFYGQDAWQVFKGFTLNYGVGWAFENKVFYHDLSFPTTGYLKPLLGNDDGKIPQRYKNFDPALGFAWAVGADQKTVLRASTSLHHNSQSVNFFSLEQRKILGPAGNGLQQVTSVTMPNPENPTGFLSFTAPTNWTIADMLAYLSTARGQFLAALPFDGKDLTFRGIDTKKAVVDAQFLDAIYNKDSARTPYTFQVDVGVQREVVRNLSVSADFVMRRGVGFGSGHSGFDQMFPDLNLWNRFVPNTYTLAANGSVNLATLVRNPVIRACTTAESLLSRTNPKAFAAIPCSLGEIQYGMPGILSNYKALQIKIDKRFSKGIQFGGAYALASYRTWSGRVVDNTDFHKSIGTSTGNPKHRFTASAIWETPKLKGGQGWMRAILNDYQLSTIVQMATAAPTSVNISGGNASFGGIGFGGFDVEGDGTFTFRLPGTTIGSFGHDIDADGIRKLVAQYNGTIPAGKDVPLSQIPKGSQRDIIGTAFPYIVLPDKFAFGDSFITHDLRLTRIIRIRENLRLNIIAEGFNIFNVANLTGFSGTLDQWIRPIAPTTANPLGTPGRNPDFGFGQATGRVNPIFGSGGPRAFQFAARLSF